MPHASNYPTLCYPSSTLHKEAAGSSEDVALIYQTTRALFRDPRKLQQGIICAAETSSLNNQHIRLLSLRCAILKVDYMGASKYSTTRGCDVQASPVRDVSKTSVCFIIPATLRIFRISQSHYCIVCIRSSSAKS
jgi:hypothetical protein